MANEDVTTSLLKASLLDLLHALKCTGIRLLLGGGFGLYLKQLYLQEKDPRTVISGELWPRPRATEDLDILLRTEIITSRDKVSLIRHALDSLDYMPIEGCEFLQFRKDYPTGYVKVDLLTGPLSESDLPLVKIDDRRVRPRGPEPQLHAHPTNEAIGFEDNPLEIRVVGSLTTGEPFEETVLVPQAFTYLFMKLYAFRDQKAAVKKGFATHHALDLYRIVCMLTREEYEAIREKAMRMSSHPVVVEGARIVAEDFASETSTGTLRLRDHPLFRPEMDLASFLAVLKELLPQQERSA